MTKKRYSISYNIQAICHKFTSSTMTMKERYSISCNIQAICYKFTDSTTYDNETCTSLQVVH